MQRIHAISFPSKELKKQFEDMQLKAKQCDHRIIGRDQQLFMQHPYSPGSPFFLPHGTRILQKLQTFLREEYRRRGYQEVVTPNIYSKNLWVQSGFFFLYYY